LKQLVLPATAVKVISWGELIIAVVIFVHPLLSITVKVKEPIVRLIKESVFNKF
jgi:hypothetical protein